MRKLLHQSSRNRFFATGLTLVEMLAVVAVMGVMLTLAAVSFNSGEARAAKVARDQVVSQLMRARSHALATATPTAVVFAPYGVGPDEDQGRVMGVVEMDLIAGSHEVLDRWERLPQGQIFLTQELLGQKSDQATVVMDSEQTLSLQVKGETVSLPYVLFSPEGMVSIPDAGSSLVAVGAGVVVNGQPRIQKKNDKAVGQEVVEVHRLTGRAEIWPSFEKK